MKSDELTGYYTYRSFLNRQDPVDDFNRIRFAEAELFLNVQIDGTIFGTLSFPAEPGAQEKQFMDINGKVENLLDQLTFEFDGQGRPNTEIFDYLYRYSGTVAHTWEKGTDQKLSLVGTVLRVQDHGSGTQIAKAGATASFVAVQREFVEPRDIEGVAIIPSALSMLASKSHRLRHMVFHTIRAVWNYLNEADKTKISNLGWGLDRPPFTQNGALDLSNGAGEDFLFMHRMMIKMVRDEYVSQGIPYIESWKVLPKPQVPQFSYSDQDDPANPGKKIYHLSIPDSGFMIPPGPADDLSIKFLKSQDYFFSVMSQLEKQFRNPRFLIVLSLGALGNLLEFAIHNQMHMRWSSISRDPINDQPKVREDFDFDDKWSSPKYDYLGEFYSSHVNPIFWRLHGWVDDRIGDWFNAHEVSAPGEIKPFEYKGISWFKPGKWVQAVKPFYWHEIHNHQNNNSQDNNEEDTKIMLKVLDIIKNAFPSDTTVSRILLIRTKYGLSSFMRAIELSQVR
jgi:hypothetical protein